MSTTSPPDDAVPITINGRTVNPQKTYAEDAERTNYITIRAPEPLSHDSEAELQELGVVIQEHVATDTYLCRYEPSDLEPVRAKSYISQVDVYRNKFKITQDLKATNDLVIRQDEASALLPFNSAPGATIFSETCTVDVLLHRDLPQSAAEIATVLIAKAHIDSSDADVTPNKIRIRVDRKYLKDVASDDRVRAIEEVLSKVTNNNYAREIMCADIRLNDTIYHGEGQIVSVADTGFDKGSIDNCHPAFKDRVIDLVPCQRKDTKPQADDPTSHGTHVCGSIVGTTQMTRMGEVGGIAPKANIVVQSLYFGKEKEIQTPTDLNNLFETTFKKHRARIHTNSWSDPWSTKGQRVYHSGAEEIDKFVCRNPDTVICFSAGNDNEPKRAGGKPAIGGEAAAKNCITVGATGSPRQHATDTWKNASPDEMGYMSSRGPTMEGRIKPDVVAPGVNILSARSQESKYQNDIADVAASQKFYPGHPKWQDPNWAVMSGTSMATPLVAGCVAVIREVFEKQSVNDPPAALVKALLINGAVRLPGIPTAAQGFGRVHLQQSIDMMKKKHVISTRYLFLRTLANNPDFGYSFESNADCDLDEEWQALVISLVQR